MIFRSQVILMVSLLFCDPCKAADVLITWLPNPETNITGYLLYYGTASRNYLVITNVATTNIVLSNLSDGTYYAALSAVDTRGLESDLSPEFWWRFYRVEWAIETSTNLSAWTRSTIHTNWLLESTNQQLFVRSAMSVNAMIPPPMLFTNFIVWGEAVFARPPKRRTVTPLMFPKQL